MKWFGWDAVAVVTVVAEAVMSIDVFVGRSIEAMAVALRGWDRGFDLGRKGVAEDVVDIAVIGSVGVFGRSGAVGCSVAVMAVVEAVGRGMIAGTVFAGQAGRLGTDTVLGIAVNVGMYGAENAYLVMIALDLVAEMMSPWVRWLDVLAESSEKLGNWLLG
jgi:hypothetical protein